MTHQFIYPILLAGLPLLVISFVLFAWGYKTNRVKPDADIVDDPEAISDDIDAEIKRDITRQEKSGSFIFDKWFEFGGGFYGIMCLVTFIHVEALDVIELSSALFAVENSGSLIELIIKSIMQLIMQSFMNFFTAFFWWNHWANILPIPAGAGFTWLICSYVGYVVGQWSAFAIFARSKIN